MARRHPPHRRPHRPRTPRRHEGPENDPLFLALREGLRASTPLVLLDVVSTIMGAADPRSHDPFAPDSEQPQVDLDELVDSFIGVPYAETTAALTVIAAFTKDAALKARIETELAGRRHPLPAWLAHLDEAQADEQVWLYTHVLDVTTEYLFGCRLVGGESVTATVHMDNSLGGMVVDAMLLPAEVEDIMLHLATHSEDPDSSLARGDAAQVRAVLEQGIDHGALLVPKPVTDTWPGSRILLEWMLTRLPDGDVAPERHEWTPEEWDAEVARFLASDFGAPFRSDDDAADLGQNLMWFATGYTAGDPHRLGPTACAELLEDWAPRKIMAEPGYLAKLPNLLRAFVRYGHDQVGIRAGITAETLAAIDDSEPEFQRLIRTERAQGAQALAEAMLGHDEPESLRDIMLTFLADRVGGHGRLMNLTADPLPDEEFEWAGIPEDIHSRVGEVLAACDGFADDVLTVEFRTAMRRFLSRAAAVDPTIFRRRSSSVRGAAAIAWVICGANRDYGTLDTGAPVRALAQHFGVSSSLSDRAAPMLRANGIDPAFDDTDSVGADLLTAAMRAEIVELRDYWLDQED